MDGMILSLVDLVNELCSFSLSFSSICSSACDSLLLFGNFNVFAVISSRYVNKNLIIIFFFDSTRRSCSCSGETSAELDRRAASRLVLADRSEVRLQL